jgi:hypothetical protein
MEATPMSAVIVENAVLGMMFVLAVAGFPLWLTIMRPDKAPDHAEARAYLAARRRLSSVSGGISTARVLAAGGQVTPERPAAAVSGRRAAA